MKTDRLIYLLFNVPSINWKLLCFSLKMTVGTRPASSIEWTTAGVCEVYSRIKRKSGKNDMD
uniref:Ig-like domain-containing protein n=1 Tax=Anopheles coluzzii TaxID=1518534 RepID=A0A6E8W377_ANOCL